MKMKTVTITLAGLVGDTQIQAVVDAEGSVATTLYGYAVRQPTPIQYISDDEEQNIRFAVVESMMLLLMQSSSMEDDDGL